MSERKWKLIRNSATDQRIWRDELAGDYYLADHSGDHEGKVGTPEHTDDGPLKINTYHLGNYLIGEGAPPVFSVPVLTDAKQERVVLCDLEAAEFLQRIYVKRKLRICIKVHDRLLELSGAEIPEWEVTIRRTEAVTRTFKVNAYTRIAAERLAMEHAGDYEFGRAGDAHYEVDHSELSK